MPSQLYRVDMSVDEPSHIPKKATEGSAAYDLYARHGYKIKKKGVYTIGTGVSLAMPKDMCALILPRSSLHKKGMRLANGVGLIDSDYRGEIMLLIEFDGFHGYEETETVIKPGDRLAQMLFMPVANSYINLTRTLSDTGRGTGGIGSTG